MLKQLFFIPIFCFLFFQIAESLQPTNIYFYDSRLSVRPMGYYMSLKTQNPNATTLIGNEKLGGGLGGFLLGYDYKKLESLYVGIRGSYALGSISGDSVRRFIHEWNAEGRFGYNYIAMQGVNIIATFYMGYGFEHFVHSRSSGNGYSSLKLKYDEYYIPVGLMFDWKIVDYFHFLFDFTWMPTVDPTVRIGGISDSRQQLRHRQNFRVELPFAFFLGQEKNWEIDIIPFWKRWVDGRTKASAVGNLSTSIPEQVLMYWGAQFLFGYRF